MQQKGKIFCIGLSRTGTTSLAYALNILGYKSIHFPSIRYIPHTMLWIKSKHLKDYEAFTDISVIPFYKKLDKKYPGSKFILTTREKESWLESCRKFPRYSYSWFLLPLKVVKLRSHIYGTVNFKEDKFSKAYDRHHADVKNYFKDRQEDLLVMDITKGDSWEKLCKFLDKPIPEVPFSRKNTRASNYDNMKSTYERRVEYIKWLIKKVTSRR